MTSIIVNNSLDSPRLGLTNLRQAVALAEGQGGGIIQIDNSISSIFMSGPFGIMSGPLELSGNISIYGRVSGTSPLVTVNGGGNGNVFTVDAGSTVTLYGLKITGGHVVGLPGLFGTFGVDGNDVTDSNKSGGSGTNGGTGTAGGMAAGGGIINHGNLTLIDDVVTGNQAIGGSGGLGGFGGAGGHGGHGYDGPGFEAPGGIGGHGGNGGAGGNGGTGGVAEGGGILNTGQLLLVNTLVTGNVVQGGQGGLAGVGKAGGQGGDGGDGHKLYRSGNLIGTGRAGAGGLGGTGGTGGNGGDGGFVTGGNIENQGSLVEAGTSVIVGASTIAPGVGGAGGGGGAGSESGITGSGPGSNDHPTPSNPGKAGSAGVGGFFQYADIDSFGPTLRLPHLTYTGLHGAWISLSNMSVLDNLSNLVGGYSTLRIKTDFGTLSWVKPSDVTPTEGSDLLVSGSVSQLNTTLQTLRLKSGINGAATVTVSFKDVLQLHTASSFVVATVTCFLDGTAVLTESGEVAVEALARGDSVITCTGGERRIAPVRWIGRRRIDPAQHPRPAEILPIRLRRDSIADGVPHRDLLISPDHAVAIDGVLVLARMLVNGATILQEPISGPLVYYHIELDEHALLLAEGLPAESYLDTGNRASFDNTGGPVQLHPEFATAGGALRRQAGSCIELALDEQRVRPVWQRLAARAEALGHTLSQPRGTDEPMLRIRINGRDLPPVDADRDRAIFVLPAGAENARLVSRAARPCDTSPWMDDRRQLGIMVRRMTLIDDAGYQPIAMDDPALQHGWFPVEQSAAGPCRWTDGDARLPRTYGPAMLEVWLGAGMSYPLPPLAQPRLLSADSESSSASGSLRYG